MVADERYFRSPVEIVAACPLTDYWHCRRHYQHRHRHRCHYYYYLIRCFDLCPANSLPIVPFFFFFCLFTSARRSAFCTCRARTLHHARIHFFTFKTNGQNGQDALRRFAENKLLTEYEFLPPLNSLKQCFCFVNIDGVQFVIDSYVCVCASVSMYVSVCVCVFISLSNWTIHVANDVCMGERVYSREHIRCDSMWSEWNKSSIIYSGFRKFITSEYRVEWMQT